MMCFSYLVLNTLMLFVKLVCETGNIQGIENSILFPNLLEAFGLLFIL